LTEDRNKDQGNEGDGESRVGRSTRRQRKAWYKSALVWIMIVLSLAVVGAGVVGIYKLSEGSADETEDVVTQTVAANTAESPMTETELTVSEMTVEQKVGQMMMIGFEGTAPDENLVSMIQERQIGGVILFGRNIDTPEQVTAMNVALQELAFSSDHPAGLLISVDQEGGKTRRFTTIGPYYSEPMIGEMPDETAEQTARLQASSAARDLKRIGINTNLAPVVDVSGGWGTVMDVRSFGTDTEMVTRLSAEAVKGYVGATAICAPKHFPGLGSAEGDPEVELTQLDFSREDIVTYELPPFAAVIEAGAPMIMVTHMVVPALDPSEVPATMSGPIIKELLRGEMGFEGVVITDDMEMGAITEAWSVSDAVINAVGAGADIVMVAHTLEEQIAAYDALVAAINAGQLDEEEIDKSVVRILDMKKMHRIIERTA
jgi:beta-N-acetylhexosaminidase